MKKIIFLLIFTSFFFCVTYAQKTDWNAIDNIFGKKGVLNGDIYKYSFPRTDLDITFDNMKIEPALALGSWVAFKEAGSSGFMIMGDLVVTDKEVPEVEKRMVSNGIDITGIHNHLLDESPTIKYVHYSAMGDAESLANKMKDVISATSTPLIASPNKTNILDTNWVNIENILGYKGTRAGNVIQFGIARKEPITEMGMEIPPYMGMSTTINIQKLNNNKAFATGDFVLVADEVNPVIKELNDAGITVTALHNHMLTENPRIFFLHYWGYDDPEKIANGLKNALGKTNSK